MYAVTATKWEVLANQVGKKKGGGQGPAPGLDNLPVGAVSRHSLDRLNDLPPPPKKGGGGARGMGQRTGIMYIPTEEEA